MLEELKVFWQRERWFTLAMVGMAGGIYFLIRVIQLSAWTKLLLGFIALLFLIIVMGGVAMAARKRTEETKEKKEVKETEEGDQLLGGIIRNVPANKVWVLRRSLFGSNIETLDGYYTRSEGWSFYIPFWHEDLGFVDLSPQPRDPKSIIVNTSDNQTAIIDWRIVTVVSNPAIFVVKVNGNRKEFEDQKATVIFNQLCSKESQDDLTKFGNDELKKMGERAMERFNEEIEYLGIKAERLEIQKILMPEEVRATAEYKTVTEKRKEVAAIKGTELQRIIDATKADPTKIVITDMARDMLTNLADVVVNAFRTRQETKKGGE